MFSCAVNMLMLAGPLYMLQVYDRVLTSRSVPTLIALSVFIAGAYAFQGFFDLIRVRVLVRASRLLDERLGTTIHAAVMQLGVRSRIAGEAQQPVRDLDAIPPLGRTARFLTVIHGARADGGEFVVDGAVEGTITSEPRGAGTFGYDPVFVPVDGDGRTFAEMAPTEKHALSHRGRAVRALLDLLTAQES